MHLVPKDLYKKRIVRKDCEKNDLKIFLIEGERERDRDRERERERQRERDSQPASQAGRQPDRQTDRQTDRERKDCLRFYKRSAN